MQKRFLDIIAQNCISREATFFPFFLYFPLKNRLPIFLLQYFAYFVRILGFLSGIFCAFER
jgi:hypothetical protein